MKLSLAAFLATLLIGGSAMGFEKRTFRSADNSKSFEATLVAYDTKTGKVTVKKGVQKMSFPLSKLSEEDVAYVEENADALAAANAIKLDFDLYKDKPETKRTDITRTITTPAGYEIEVSNWTEQKFRDVEVNYSIYHRKDAENGPGSIAETKGSFSLTYLANNSESTTRTTPINLIRYSRKKSGGG